MLTLCGFVIRESCLLNNVQLKLPCQRACEGSARGRLVINPEDHGDHLGYASPIDSLKLTKSMEKREEVVTVLVVHSLQVFEGHCD